VENRTSKSGKLGFAKLAAALVALLLLGVMASGAMADGDPFSALDALTTSTATTTSTSADTTSASSTTTDTAGASTDAATTTAADTTTTAPDTTTDATTGATATTTTTTTTAALAPSIVSDLADYPPGSTVTLTGSGWGAGESVHLFVNDAIGQSWQYNGDVLADLSGAFSAQFQLPNTFISNYDVTATGSAGENATTTFTDGNLASASGTVTDSVTHAAISGATVTCNTSTGCNATISTTTDASGNYLFDASVGHTKLSFAGNGPVALSLTVTKTGYADGTVSLGAVNNTDTVSGKNVALVPSGPTKLAFTTVVVSGAVAQCLGPITVQTQDASSAPTNVTAITTVNLATDNGGTGSGGFFSDSGCSTSVTSRTIASGSNSTSFFYKATARGTGSHVLTASATGLTSASQTETITKANQATLSITAPSSMTFGDADATISTSGGSGTGALTFSAGGSTACSIASGKLHVLSGTGTCSITATRGADNDFNSATSAPFAVTINKASSTTKVTCPASVTYDGLAQTPCTVAVTGAGLSLSPDAAYSSNTNAGLATASYTFAGDGNHTGSNDSQSFAITPRDVTAAITAANKTYDGTKATTATCALNAQSGSVGVVTGDTNVDCVATGAEFDTAAAGTGKTVTANVALTGTGAGNYNLTNSSDTDLASIGQKQLLVTANNQAMVINGTVPPLTYAITGYVNSEAFGTTSGVAGAASCTTATGTAVGTFPIVCTQGTLNGGTNYKFVAGAPSAGSFANGTLTVSYSTASCLGSAGHAILQPVNADGTSVFKQGSTVPAKFRVCDANGVSIGTAGTVASFRLVKTVTGTVASTVDEAVDSTTPDTAFRWSSTDQQWIYNVNTKSLKANYTYYYDIALNDGTHVLFQFGLK
jgi:hypothetical protein